MLERIKNNRIYTFLSISLILVLFDQITKIIFTSKNYFSSFFIHISYSENGGSAFGLFSNIIYYNYLIIFLSILILFFLFYKIKFFFKNKFYSICFVLLISGIIGNLIDRIFFGFVRDFIVLEHFFIFNLADFYLSFALIYFFVYEYVEYIEHKKN